MRLKEDMATKLAFAIRLSTSSYSLFEKQQQTKKCI
jgi:hypothetical protein